jgi:hypothetical protein
MVSSVTSEHSLYFYCFVLRSTPKMYVYCIFSYLCGILRPLLVFWAIVISVLRRSTGSEHSVALFTIFLISTSMISFPNIYFLSRFFRLLHTNIIQRSFLRYDWIRQCTLYVKYRCIVLLHDCLYLIRYYSYMHSWFLQYNAGDLLVPEGIILPVLGASALTWFIRYIFINIYSSKLRNHYKN